MVIGKSEMGVSRKVDRKSEERAKCYQRINRRERHVIGQSREYTIHR